MVKRQSPLSSWLVDGSPSPTLSSLVERGETDAPVEAGSCLSVKARHASSLTPSANTTSLAAGDFYGAQQLISAALDKGFRDNLKSTFESESNSPALNRISELSDPNVAHSWSK